MTIAQFGTFEVENYGDRLFPIIVEKELALRAPDLKLKLFSPLADDELGVSAIRDMGKVDAMIVGGGDIISFSNAIASIYTNTWKEPFSPHSACFAYPGIYRNPGVPLLWNAPGIPADFTEEQIPLVRQLAEEADYLSVRDKTSKARLEKAGVSKQIHIVPDTALALPKHFPKDSLKNAFGKQIVVQLHPYHIQDHISETVEMLCQINEPILLLPIGKCHDDHVVLAEIEKAGKGKFQLISHDLETLEVTAVIAHAKAFIGTSLHGAITAFAYGVPFLTYSCANLSKLQGFLELVESEDRLCLNLEEILQKLTLLDQILSREAYQRAALLIDTHFDQMVKVMRAPSNFAGENREALRKSLEKIHEQPREIEVIECDSIIKRLKRLFNLN